MGADSVPVPVGTTDSNRTEAPTTWKSYLMCVFAAFGGVFFGYDSGYISGVLAMPYFINQNTGIPIPPPGAAKAVTDAFVVRIYQAWLGSVYHGVNWNN